MVENEGGSADGIVPVRELKFRICVELFIRQVRQVRLRPRPDFLLHNPGISDGRIFSGVAIGITEPLERMNPKFFAVENVNRLLA